MMLLVLVLADVCLGQYCSDAADETQCLTIQTFIDLDCGYGTGLTNYQPNPHSLCQPCDFFETALYTSGYLTLAKAIYNESACNALTNCIWNTSAVHPLATTYSLPLGVCEFTGAPVPAPTALWDASTTAPTSEPETTASPPTSSPSLPLSSTSEPETTAQAATPSAAPIPETPTAMTVQPTRPPTSTPSTTAPPTTPPPTILAPPSSPPTQSFSDNRDTILEILVPIGIVVPLVALYVHNRMATSKYALL